MKRWMILLPWLTACAAVPPPVQMPQDDAACRARWQELEQQLGQANTRIKALERQLAGAKRDGGELERQLRETQAKLDALSDIERNLNKRGSSSE